MSGSLPGNSLHHGSVEAGAHKVSHDKSEEGGGGGWYFSRKEIEENSPSRRDGVDLKKETYLCKSYCTFLQDLGMRLQVPQVTIATAIIFCHRFFLRQSHAKNDRRTIATVCMFLAGKVEETPRPLKDVILVSYEIIHKKDPAAVQRIKQKDVYEQQKELILIGERVVLATLGFDLNVHHPYKPLVEAIKKFKVAQNALAQVAWNFVNDGLRTSLCLQFKPHHIAAGAIFLAAKFLKVKLPSDGEKVWWQEFDVTPRQLEEVSNQMLELYEQNRVPPSQASEAEGSAGGNQRSMSKVPGDGEENVVTTNHPQGSAHTSRGVSSKPAPPKPVADADNNVGSARASQSRNNENRSFETRGDIEMKNNQQHERGPQRHQGNTRGFENITKSGYEGQREEERENSVGRTGPREMGEFKDSHNRTSDHKDGAVSQSPQEVINKIDKNKVKAALEKRRKTRPEVRKTDPMDDDDLIESALENGFQLDESKSEKKQSWSKHSNRLEHDGGNHLNHQYERSSSHGDIDNVEEGEVGSLDGVEKMYRSPKHRKRMSGSPVGGMPDGRKQRHDYMTGPSNHSRTDFPEDKSKLGKLGYSERDHERHVQENHV